MRVLLHLAFLASLALFVFREGFSHQFTNWDDGQYIVENSLVHGLSWDRIVTAFSGFHVANYNPLHLISYMVDYELWGLHAGKFFATGLLLHTLTAFLVHEVARRFTGSAGAALVVAAVFLIHPTRVESVAWLSERKDLLSGLFSMGSLLAYMNHREARSAVKGKITLAASCILYLLALLSKTQVVTLPLVLVALDLVEGRGLKSSLLGKVPFFVLSILFSVVTVAAALGDEGTRGFELPGSILDPIAALPHYVLHMFWPIGLSPYYGHPEREFHGALALSSGTLVLLGLGFLAWRSWR
ncbi:MAG TPA: hypothetical protein VMT52_11865, partial [Planctomycetota bacterium]|nr:hypothetical protein [Planctomycetota bacterium]